MHLSNSRFARRASYPVLFAFFAITACSPDNSPTTPSQDSPDLARGGVQGPDFRAAKAAQDKHTERLLAKAGVEGTGLTLTADGRPAIVVFTRHGAVGGLPAEIEGVPVVLQVTGEFQAILPKAKPQAKPGGANPTARFPRPVPTGVSIGNIGECSAGTLGARVTKGNSQYVLSNNHVLALQNTAPNGSDILQPGRYDTNCSSSLADVIADLSDYVQINFSGGNNTVDAAIAAVRTGAVGNATFTGGYGLPSRTTVAPFVNQAVQKCGRTTKCTQGTVGAINATVNVNYGESGVARFVNQVVISGKRGAFSKAGDSGSLIVTDNAAANPVALLFAGSQTITIGNPIGPVLQALGITIDGK